MDLLVDLINSLATLFKISFIVPTVPPSYHFMLVSWVPYPAKHAQKTTSLGSTNHIVNIWSCRCSLGNRHAYFGPHIWHFMGYKPLKTLLIGKEWMSLNKDKNSTSWAIKFSIIAFPLLKWRILWAALIYYCNMYDFICWYIIAINLEFMV